MNISGYYHLVIILMYLQGVAHTLNESHNSEEYVYKCVAVTGDIVKCNSSGIFDVKLETKRIAKQNPNHNYYQVFHVTQNALFTELPENAFNGLRIGILLMLYATKLTRIHKNAFTGTASTTNQLTIISETQLQNSPPDYDLYYALSTLTNVTSIQISLDSSVNHTIPDNAFRNVNGVQSRLNKIKFSMVNSFSRNTYITRIGNNAFYDIPFESNFNIDFDVYGIQTVSSKAFDLKTYSNNTLTINLSIRYLTHHSFEDNAFSGSRRPLDLILDNNGIQYIEEKTFSSFFSADERNVMRLQGNDLNCKNITRFIWLLANKQQLENRVLNARCSDGRNLWDLEIPANTSTTPTSGSSFMKSLNGLCLMLIISVYIIF